MSEKDSSRPFTRRDFLKMGGGMLGAAAGAQLVGKAILKPDSVVEAAVPVTEMAANKARVVTNTAQNLVQGEQPPDFHFVASDGWCHIPGDAEVPPYHPDDMAPAGLTTYMFGFRDVTMVTNNAGLDAQQKQQLVHHQKQQIQTMAPLFWLKQVADDAPSSVGYRLRITNLGLAIRPDLIDAHTLHFHGFRNAIPIFDGEPHSSVGVPINRDLTYFYRPHDPGTYMYHCHFEETEHVHMGMVGPTFITPYQNVTGAGPGVPVARLEGGSDPNAPRGYAYNDGDGSTAYDREFVAFLSEVWAESHWCDSHVQLPEWSDYKPEFYLLNGRVYPDTLLPHGGGYYTADNIAAGQALAQTLGWPYIPEIGDLIPPHDPSTDPDPANWTWHPHLRYQPMSGLIEVNAGERVLLRWINLGFEHQAMRLDGIKMRVIAKDAAFLRGRNDADLSFLTNTISIGPGESVDAIFEAPPYQGGAPYDRYLLYNRKFNRLNNGGHGGYGGQMTEVRVYPAGTLGEQQGPNNRSWWAGHYPE